MRPLNIRIILGALALGLLGTAGWAQRADVLPPQRRVATVEQAVHMLDRGGDESLPDDLNNPFFPNSMKPKPNAPAPAPAAPGEPEVVQPTGPSNDYDLLETIAPELNPSGTMILGGQPLLLFGQKKIRVGDQLPIIYQGKRYTLTISDIESSFFTIRLGEAEYTRPIKNDN
ncbi:hypothetical protein [Synoicihabitans lomoniglobus]|uniref:Uncharacterized protein n=1 Tax=Synoicihabitans lomoniglobus TaxID=2909285 RepID=A0AAE9ZWC8_9BACT|nr:hypothetical protein [Opitutaceae bacterium LMO-M01]WED65461.1 hypothetical protein PXH66_01185 [Opitutaceae bacterium LMO-M01]